MEHAQDNPEGRQRRPHHALTAALPSLADSDALQSSLATLGVDLEDVVVLHGAEGIRIFDITGEGHGRLAKAIRTWKTVLSGADGEMLRDYDQALRRDMVVVLVPVAAGRERQELVDVLVGHGAMGVRYFGTGTMEDIPN